MHTDMPKITRRSLLTTLPLLAATSPLLAAERLTRPSGIVEDMPVSAEKTLLLKNADMVVTMDATRREIRNGSILIKGNIIVAVGNSADLPQTADEVINMKGHIVIPGLINTHHHMCQSLTRVIPSAQDGELFKWLTTLYPIWEKLTPEMIHISTLMSMAELILSGCTTLGVDGSASNDTSNLIGEVRQAMLLQRVGFGPDAMTARQALEIATLGGARVLNRDDVGALSPGMMADIAAFNLSKPGMAGALHDPVAALVFCNPGNVAYSIVDGQVLVKEGQMTKIDLPTIIELHKKLAARLY